METLKTPSEYSVDFKRGFQGFSMANLEKGHLCEIILKMGQGFRRSCRLSQLLTIRWTADKDQSQKLTLSLRDR